MMRFEHVCHERVLEFIKSSIGEHEPLVPVVGGLVHFVFSARAESGKEYIIKIRSTQFSGIPGIECAPEEVIREAEALNAVPLGVRPMFPELISVNPEIGCIIETSIMLDEEVLTKRIRRGKFSSEDALLCGKQVSEFHGSTKGVEISPVLSNEDIYRRNLEYRITFHDHPAGDLIASKLRQRPRQLIHGDLSIKNIGLTPEGMRCCDLELAHLGNIEFDFGFLLAHLIIHAIEVNSPSLDWCRALVQGYQDRGVRNDCDFILALRVALITILYRLRNSTVPYQTHLGRGSICRLIELVAEDLLLRDLSIEDIFQAIEEMMNLEVQ